MGWMTGVEPATPGITIRCSNQLSYTHHMRGGFPSLMYLRAGAFEKAHANPNIYTQRLCSSPSLTAHRVRFLLIHSPSWGPCL